MAENKRFAKASWAIMAQLLKVDNLEEALSGSLDIIVKTLNSEAGAIWLLDPKTDRLSPVFHIGPADISNISVENGLGIEGIVTQTGKSMFVEDAATDPRFDGTVFDDNDLVTKTMICVPLNNTHDIIGCVQIVNKLDGTLYDEEEMQLCERMASLAAITIDEKGLIVDLEEKKEILATLRNITKEFQTGDTTKAGDVYGRVIQYFPNSAYASQAQQFISSGAVPSVNVGAQSIQGEEAAANMSGLDAEAPMTAQEQAEAITWTEADVAWVDPNTGLKYDMYGNELPGQR